MLGHSSEPPSCKLEKNEINSHNGLQSLSRCICLGDTWESTKVAVGGEKVLAVIDVKKDHTADLPHLSVSRQLGSRARKTELVRVTDVKWHPSLAHKIGTASASGMVLVWDVNKGSHDHLRRHSCDDMQRTDHTRLVKRIFWHPSQANQLLSASQDSTVKLWDLRMYKQNAPLTFRTSQVGNVQIRDVEVDPFDHNAFVCSTDETAELLYWDIRMHDRGPKRRVSASLEGSGKGAINTLNWHPTKRGILVTGSKDRSIRVWDMHSPVADLDVTAKIIIQTLAAVGRLQWRPSLNGDTHQLAEVSMSPLDADLNIWDEFSPLLPLCCVRKPHGEVITDLEWWDANGELIFSTSKSGSFAVSLVKNSYVHSAHMPTSGVVWSPDDTLSFVNDTIHFPEAGRVRGDLTAKLQGGGPTSLQQRGRIPSLPCLSQTSRFRLVAQAPEGTTPWLSEDGALPTGLRSPVSPLHGTPSLSTSQVQRSGGPPGAAAATPVARERPPPPAKKPSTGLFAGLFGRKRSQSDYTAPLPQNARYDEGVKAGGALPIASSGGGAFAGIASAGRTVSEQSISEMVSQPARLSGSYGGIPCDPSASLCAAGGRESQADPTPQSRRCTVDYVSPFPQQMFSSIPIGLRNEPGQGLLYTVKVGSAGSDFTFLAENYMFEGKQRRGRGGDGGSATPGSMCLHNASVVRKLMASRRHTPDRKQLFAHIHSAWNILNALCGGPGEPLPPRAQTAPGTAAAAAAGGGPPRSTAPLSEESNSANSTTRSFLGGGGGGEKSGVSISGAESLIQLQLGGGGGGGGGGGSCSSSRGGGTSCGNSPVASVGGSRPAARPAFERENPLRERKSGAALGDGLPPSTPTPALPAVTASAAILAVSTSGGAGAVDGQPEGPPQALEVAPTPPPSLPLGGGSAAAPAHTPSSPASPSSPSRSGALFNLRKGPPLPSEGAAQPKAKPHRLLSFDDTHRTNTQKEAWVNGDGTEEGPNGFLLGGGGGFPGRQLGEEEEEEGGEGEGGCGDSGGSQGGWGAFSSLCIQHADELEQEGFLGSAEDLTEECVGGGGDAVGAADPFSPSDQFISIVDLLLDLGEVQTAVTAVLCMRSAPHVFDPAVHAARGAEWLVAYHDLLLASDLHTVAAALMKHCPFPDLVNGGLSVDAKCKTCGQILAPLNDQLPSISGTGTQQMCQSCCHQARVCAVCLGPVKGLYVWSRLCHHGGHLKCMVCFPA